jgi:hypothetical protein
LLGVEFVAGAASGGGGGSRAMRVTKTVNSFLSDNSFRPPSGVPVMAK